MHSNVIAAVISKHTVSVMDYALGLDKPRIKGYISLEMVAELADAIEKDSECCANCGSPNQEMRGPLPYCVYCKRYGSPIKAADFIKRSKER